MSTPPTPPTRLNGIRFPDGSVQVEATLPIVNALALGGNGALRVGLPSQPPALTTTPTITVTNAQPGSTPTAVNASASQVVATNRFTFSGGVYETPSNTFPFTTAAGRLPLPNNTLGFGNSYVDFLSDAPAITFQHQRAELSGTKLIVDGVEVWRCVPGIRANTAQAGAATTITLDAGASATNGQYVGNWVHITGGTGSGQYAQITAYVGATKVATVGQTWGTNPDATSTFEITDSKAPYSNLTNTGFGTYFVNLAWNGERRMRHYRVEHGGQAFYGVEVTSSADTVCPAEKPNATKCFWLGDSFGAGTGTDSEFNSMARVCCDLMGWELVNLSVGGTGVLNPGSGVTGSLTLPQRVTPPVNAWYVKYDGATAGSFTVTQNSITVTVNQSDSQATIQASFDAAFGAGAFSIIRGGASTEIRMWVVGLGANATFAGAMTANFASLTGASATATIAQWKGDLALNAPVDGNGVALPFVIVIAMGHNDTTDTNAAYTAAAMQSAMTTLLQAITATYPRALIFVVGNMFLPGASVDAAVTASNGAISAACVAALPTINAKVPFIDTITSPWFTGTGHVGALAANGNSDYCCWTDGIHPSTFGHLSYGRRLAQTMQTFLLGS